MSQLQTTTIGELNDEERKAAMDHKEVLKGGAKILLNDVASLHEVGVAMLCILAMDAAIMRKILFEGGVRNLSPKEAVEHACYQLALSALARLLRSNPQFGTGLLQDQIDNALNESLKSAFDNEASIVIQRHEPGAQGRMIDFDEDKARAFIRRHEQAVANGDDKFEFEGCVFVTGYAKYVAEHLGNAFNLA